MRMRILTPDGIVEADISDPSDRSIVGAHWSAVGYYANTRSPDRLFEFEFTEVGDGIRLATNPDVIDEFWFAGELDFIEVYTSRAHPNTRTGI